MFFSPRGRRRPTPPAGGGGYSFANAEASAYNGRLASPLDDERAAVVDDFFSALKLSPLSLSIFDFITIHAIDPEENILGTAFPWTTVGTVIHEPWVGVRSDGTTGYLTNALPGDWVDFSQNSAAFGVFVEEEPASVPGGGELAGQVSGSSGRLRITPTRTSDGDFGARICGSADVQAPVSHRIGLSTAVRDSGNVILYKDDTAIATIAQASADPAAQTGVTSLLNVSGAFALDTVFLTFASSELSAAQVEALFGAIMALRAGINTSSWGYSTPSSLVQPQISGDTVPGSILTADNLGDWAGVPAPVLTLQWRRFSTDLSGETNLTLDTTGFSVGDTVRLRVTGTNSQGSSFRDSNAITITSAATSQIAFVTAQGYATTGGTLPAGPVGQLILAMAAETGSGVLPAMPDGEGWEALVESANLVPSVVVAGSIGALLNYMITNDANEGSSGPFEGAASVVFGRWSGVHAGDPILSVQWATGNGGNVMIPATTHDDPLSWLAYLYRFQQAVEIAPVGWQPRLVQTRRGIYDSGGPLQTFSGLTCPVVGGLNPGRWVGCAVAMRSA